MATAPTPTAAKPSTIDSTGQTQVSFTNYNARGEDYSDIDQAGIETRTIYDDDGRTASVIQNYQDGGNLTPATASDQNLTTLYLYASGSGVSSVSQVEANTSSSLIDVTATTGTALDGGSGTFLMYSANTSDTSQSDQTSEGDRAFQASANVVKFIRKRKRLAILPRRVLVGCSCRGNKRRCREEIATVHPPAGRCADRLC